MATLGALLSQQLGFTVTTTGGTVYTHGLGFTPTFCLITPFGTLVTPCTSFCWGTPTATTIQIGAIGPANQIVDVLCGSIHSLIR